jgi:WD40 repeat protein
MIPAQFFATLKPILSVSPVQTYLAATFGLGEGTDVLRVWSVDLMDEGSWANPFYIESTIACRSGRAVDFSPTEKRMAFAGHPFSGSTPYFKIFSTDDWSEAASPTVTGYGAVSNNCLKYSPNGEYLAVGVNASPYLRVFNTSDWSLVTIPTPPTSTVSAVAWNGDGTRLMAAVASGGSSNSV